MPSPELTLDVWRAAAEAIKHCKVEPDLEGAALTGEELDAIEAGWKPPRV
jgi:hypothetical protein